MIYLFLNGFFVSKVYAEDLQGKLSQVVEGTGEGFSGFVQRLLDFAVPLGVFCALVLLGYAAFMMITSAGNPEKLKEAREVATNAIIGAIMIGMGVIVLTLLSERLGLGVG